MTAQLTLAPPATAAASPGALAADTHRACGRSGAWPMLRRALGDRTFRCLATLRLCQALARRRLGRALLLVPARLLHRWACGRAGIDLPWRTDVGPGLAIMHGWGLVVNGAARIGRNVTLFHGVTLGRRDRIAPDGTRETRSPVIEDEVWIGPHAVIVGGVTVGRGSRIAAGAFVTEDVPPRSVVVGNPAAVVRRDCTPDVWNPAP